MTRELLQQALDALENPALPVYTTLRKEIRMALAAPMPEPVAWMAHQDKMLPTFHRTFTAARGWADNPTPLYAAPPAAPTPSNQLSGNSGALNLIAPAPVVCDREIVITKNKAGVIVSVTVQNDEGRIISVLAESAAPVVREPLSQHRVNELCAQLTMEPYQVRAIERAHGIGGGGNG